MTTGKIATALAALALLSACGGDDSPAPQPVADLPPSFGQDTLELDVRENTAGTFHTIVISDENIPGVLITLDGRDADDFAIDADGNLSFTQPPDFENPADEDGDNIYEFQVIAVDANGNRSVLDVTITVTDDATAMRFVDPVFAGTQALGTVSIAAPSGIASVTFTGPAGDTLMARPLVLLGGAQEAGTEAMARDLALRGYLVGTVDTAGAADLAAIAAQFADGAFASLGIDAGAISVAAPGDADVAALLQTAFAGSGIPTFAFAPGSTSAQSMAGQLNAALGAGQQ